MSDKIEGPAQEDYADVARERDAALARVRGLKARLAAAEADAAAMRGVICDVRQHETYANDPVAQAIFAHALDGTAGRALAAEVEALRKLEAAALALAFHDHAADVRERLAPCVELVNLYEARTALDAARRTT